MKMTSLNVSTPEGNSGRVFASAADFVFRYDDDARSESAISLSMPVRLDDFRRRDLHPVFQMNLPEGYVLEQLRNRLAKTTNVDPFLLLALPVAVHPLVGFTCAQKQLMRCWGSRDLPGKISKRF
jgi:serine/threonine-protein kinase HipA